MERGWIMEEDQPKADPALVWIQQIAAGDRDAFENLYHAYQTRVFRYLVHMVGDSQTAEELTNDVMVAAWKGAADFKGQSKPSTWLLGIARHKALNELRRPRPATVEVESVSEAAVSDEDPEKAAGRAGLRRGIQQALQELSEEHREVVELTFYQELSYIEIAEVMHCPVNTVKTRMFYARKKLQEVLERSGMKGDL